MRDARFGQKREQKIRLPEGLSLGGRARGGFVGLGGGFVSWWESKMGGAGVGEQEVGLLGGEEGLSLGGIESKKAGGATKPPQFRSKSTSAKNPNN